MAGFRLAANARDDLERIWFYGLEKWGVEQADRYLHALFERFEALAEDPFHYPSVDHIREGYRRCVIGSDSVYYRTEGSEIEIMAIIGRQDIDSFNGMGAASDGACIRNRVGGRSPGVQVIGPATPSPGCRFSVRVGIPFRVQRS